ncbi:hypothetical protein HH310_24225 [Actinoplanes sp. TBRC 11911]|uniref:hypothetical protein n=1 Tax=Actinoplanes sp. TBRC 11911 TaxID=2729386 RepID=UPI00145D46D1|nr:hypothetical protein [Actinoplanes sp. TBRC 11911]NMO54278.1 hypothetical protein [Actinoplanes sp. TBRC 11911]
MILIRRTAVLLAALTVAACGSPSDPQVATLGSGATPSSSAATTATNRPQLRLDTSDAERDRLFTAYDDCLVAHGVKVNPVDQPGAVGNGPGRRLDQSGEPKSAYVACAGKLPQQPPELDADRNPNYAAQWNDNVECLRAHGMMVHVTKPGEWTWDSSDTVVPDNEADIEKSCLLEAFGGGK